MVEDFSKQHLVIARNWSKWFFGFKNWARLYTPRSSNVEILAKQSHSTSTTPSYSPIQITTMGSTGAYWTNQKFLDSNECLAGSIQREKGPKTKFHVGGEMKGEPLAADMTARLATPGNTSPVCMGKLKWQFLNFEHRPAHEFIPSAKKCSRCSHFASCHPLKYQIHKRWESLPIKYKVLVVCRWDDVTKGLFRRDKKIV